MVYESYDGPASVQRNVLKNQYGAFYGQDRGHETGHDFSLISSRKMPESVPLLCYGKP
jgi:hypothetical protein